MKTALTICFLIISFTAFAQKHPFIRVFTTVDGKDARIIRGKINNISDSSIMVGGTLIAYKNIGVIKTKHSFGHNILMYTVGAISLGIATGAYVNQTQHNEGGCGCVTTIPPGPEIGLIIGTTTGIVAGTVVGAFKKVTTISVYGNLQNWQAASAILQQKMQ